MESLENWNVMRQCKSISRCKNKDCKTSLKNKKKYTVIERLVAIKTIQNKESGYEYYNIQFSLAIDKECRKCGRISRAE